jgi:CheY-like chemotaxis protein
MDSDLPGILIVDDNDDNRYTLQLLLESDGHERISSASGGNEAIALLDKKKFNLVLLDLMMPDLNGDEVLKIIKGNPDTRDIPVAKCLASRGQSLRQLFYGGIHHLALLIACFYRPLGGVAVLILGERLFIVGLRRRLWVKLSERPAASRQGARERNDHGRHYRPHSTLRSLTQLAANVMKLPIFLLRVQPVTGDVRQSHRCVSV